jgi:hypothetical protein
VGYGDYRPISDYERIFITFIFVFGVAVFSYIMGNFINILGMYNTLNADFDEGDRLSSFFGLLKNFNN